MMKGMFAAVVLDIPIDKAFHYSVPEKLSVHVGMRVRVPFRQQIKTGFVVGLTDRAEVGYTKPIYAVLDETPLVDARTIELARWIADYYVCSWGEALFAVIPPGARRSNAAKTVRHVEIENPPLIQLRSDRQKQIVDYLQRAQRAVAVREVVARTGCSHAHIRTLVEKGILREKHVKVEPDLFSENAPAAIPDIELTDEQDRALRIIEEKLASAQPGVIVLHGVTGSGKTEVYLRAMIRAKELGKRSIFLVPEVALTPQTVSRVRSRFEKIAVLHSTLTESDRGEQWRMARRGEVDVVVGARSAVFAPLKNLGVIVIDEEHEATYKQDSTPRYHAREVALQRAKQEGALVILGSATPSLESFYRAKQGEFELVELTKRVQNLPMPSVRVIDMEVETSSHRGLPIVSKPLEEAVKIALEKGEQIILFLNRRGYASFSRCGRCGYLAKCRRCDTAISFHRDRGRWMCHYCLEETTLTSSCPKCSQGKLGMFGLGTQKVEVEVGRLFPDQSIRRMDSDAMKTRDDYRESLGKLWSGETDILVGTQMIAKGLDVPDVTVVGVISADTAFHIPDFRSAERTFQMVTQVAGRAGRGPRGGTVYVQTLHSTHYSIARAASYDFAGFAEKELAMRQELGFPPFGHLVRIIGESKEEKGARLHLEEIAHELKKSIPQSEAALSGPVPAPIPRLRNHFRFHILLKCADLAAVQRKLRAREWHKPTAVRVVLDVDPVSLL
jgi:primosomal protein N' (replication factor Y)